MTRSKSTVWSALLLAILACSSSTSSAAPEHSSLRLRRWIIRTDAQGHHLLTVNFGNYGDRAVLVRGICATNDNWFSDIRNAIQPGDVWDGTVEVSREPAFVWVDTSEGRFRFDLIPSR